MKYQKFIIPLFIISVCLLLFSNCDTKKTLPTENDFKLNASVSSAELKTGESLKVTVSFINNTDKEHSLISTGDLINVNLVNNSSENQADGDSKTTVIAANETITKEFEFTPTQHGDHTLKISVEFGIKQSEKGKTKYYTYKLDDMLYKVK